MGLLSDPSLTPRGKFGRTLAKHSGKISLFFYIAGLAWFVCLSHPEFSHGTYLSENALSPGLVDPEIGQDSVRLAQTLYEELQRERTDHKSTTPHAWIAAKMHQIGLETHVHNFTLHYPFSTGKEYHGKNVYGILRAPRISSTEGVVYTAPYRAVNSVHTDITASVPMLLAFADFARKKNYWAKDLVFLVTEQEQLGMHAWLEAYHEGGIKDSPILRCGNLPARAGALQAALNLEIQDLDIDYIDVKIEGLNGQLPNLDMFNLVQRLTSRSGLSSGYKHTPRKKRRSNRDSLEDNLRHMVEMLKSQATGVPNGNHGLFHRYRIESLTLEAVKRTTNTNNSNRYGTALSLLKTVEGISRSLNNLLERFHQSYFFYILVQNDRFVSIGDYMPCLIALASPMFIKAFLLWLTTTSADDSTSEEEDTTTHEERLPIHLPYISVLLYMVTALLLGFFCNALPYSQHVRDYFNSMGVSTQWSVGVILAVQVLIGILLPLFYTLPEAGLELLHIGVLIFTGVALIVTGLLNFALGFILAAIISPVTILLQNEHNNGLRQKLTRIYTFVLNPMIVIYLLVLWLILFEFPELALKDMAVRAISASLDAITYGLMDSIIYGNWLYTAIAAIYFPLWILYWTLALGRKSYAVTLDKKLN
ncbi:PREDICTED: glycosylphosphatidylinositol anchor attachment 1 protein [Bactrocera latifrons]|uniref:Glycosylphosphatidylinositol anchor attachment 1 protein n=1 Tax=Bactrocera latifrons TaxID=174628 RepID=A0A0K8V6W0_BACLA|nr:PREDICTED: glycosylphosphatidylinositol anchor attachment 1 protein [Bactrocera latifrons]